MLLKGIYNYFKNFNIRKTSIDVCEAIDELKVKDQLSTDDFLTYIDNVDDNFTHAETFFYSYKLFDKLKTNNIEVKNLGFMNIELDYDHLPVPCFTAIKENTSLIVCYFNSTLYVYNEDEQLLTNEKIGEINFFTSSINNNFNILVLLDNALKRHNEINQEYDDYLNDYLNQEDNL